MPSTAEDVEILPFDEARDSYEEVTRLLHAAYRGLAEAGLNYVAATQDAKTTRERMSAATACWLARQAGNVAGTLSYYAESPSLNDPDWYRRNEVSFFGQFGVEPSLQGSGIGSRLLAAAEARAVADAKREFACDTAEPARHLVAYYSRHGFRVVGRHRWPHADYESLILSKRVGITIRRATGGEHAGDSADRAHDAVDARRVPGAPARQPAPSTWHATAIASSASSSGIASSSRGRSYG